MLKFRHSGKSILTELTIGLLVGFAVLSFSLVNFFQPLELLAIDWRFLLRGRQALQSEVVVVGITQDDLHKLGMFPWPRSHYARLIDYLNESGAKVICFDMFFASSDPEPLNDRALSEATRIAGNVIYPVFTPQAIKESQVKGKVVEASSLIQNLSILSTHSSQGHINVHLDSDGTVRRIPLAIRYQGRQFWTLGLEAVLKYLDIDGRNFVWQKQGVRFPGLEIPTGEDGNMFINYVPNLEEEIENYSFSEVLEGKALPQRFEGKIVLIGQMTHGLPNADILRTPFKEKYGLVVQANIIYGILHRTFIRRPSLLANASLILLLAAFIQLISARLPVREGFVFVLALLASYIAVSVHLFNMNGVILEITPMIAISLLTIGAKNLRAYREVKELSFTDGLTGLYNHRYLEMYLGEAKGESQQDSQPLSLIMLDLDHFKRYNDTYGHPAGDIILRELGQLLRRNTRRGDLVARYGGEEFIIVLPTTGKAQALSQAERVRKEVEDHSFRVDGGPRTKVTISAGVASFSEDDLDGESLVEKADRALYQAKREGRNRIFVFQGEADVQKNS